MADLMEVTLTYEYFNQLCINRWNYITDSTPAAASLSVGLALAFAPSDPSTPDIFTAPSPAAAIQTLMNDKVTFNNIEVRNVYSVVDFFNTPFISDAKGFVTGEGLSPTMAFGFRSNRVRTDIRRGFKRFVGVSEASQGDGGVVTPGTLSFMQTLADEMARTLTFDDEGNTLSYAPAIVSKEPYTTPSGRTAYRYYADKDTQLENTATSILWQPYEQIRTQTSRQYGRGN